MKGGWSITRINQSETRVDIFIQLKVALFNSSSKSIDMNSFGYAIETSMKKSYQITYLDNFMSLLNRQELQWII